MEVGSDYPDHDRGDYEGVERTKPRIANPQDGDYGANCGRVSGREGGESLSALEGKKAEYAVVYEGWIVAHPGFRPGPPEGEFQLVLDGVSHCEARHREARDGQQSRKRTAAQGAQRGGEKEKHQKWLHELGQLGDLCEDAEWPQSLMREDRNRPIEPEIRGQHGANRQDERDRPFLHRVH
jgi:hypothetical protein